MSQLTFRRGPFFSERSVTLNDESIRLHAAQGKMLREIAWDNVASIHWYAGVTALDEAGNRFPILHYRIVPRRGRSIALISSYYLRPGPGKLKIAKNHNEQCEQLMTTIQHRAATHSPDAHLVTGSRMTSVLGYALAVLCVVLLGLVVYATIASGRPLSDTWQLLAFTAAAGLFFGYLCYQMGRIYAPERTKLSEVFKR